MTREQWHKVKAIVFEAQALAPSSRAAFVAKACAGDDSLQREVSSLLESMELAQHRYETPAFDPRDAGPLLQSVIAGGGQDAPIAMMGRRIGPYEIQREVGRGGMGAVYLATRADSEFRHEVALKIIKRGMDTDAIVRRFRTERQILADFKHPNIARLLDGGTTSDGLPYLVMEYVQGQPITTYCDERRLGIDERLALFRTICAAVAYAHQHLVVHRDIKPSNVLVSSDGEPKLLDFGLAKILGSGADAHETETVHRWMTPAFASPEQLRGDRVTTVSDVYSLGVLLFELLCGRRPFSRFETAGVELLRAIGEQEPERPSAAAGSDVIEVSRVRNTSPERLLKTLRGDLDNIVLKALEKDPSRRYTGAGDCSEDIRRFLEGLPVSARPDTLTYIAAKFVRRHRAAAVAAAVMAVTLVSATVITAAQASIARRERANAERRFKEVRQLANAFLFDFHDAIATLPGSTPAREMVVKKAQEYLNGLAEEAGTDRDLLSELSTAYLKLGDVQGRPSASRTGDTDGALASYSQSLQIRRRLAAAQPGNVTFQQDVAITLVRIGRVLEVRGDPMGAIERGREAMDITQRLVARAPSAELRRDAFRAPLYLGDALFGTGDYDGALSMFTKALEVAETARLDPPEADFKHRMAVAKERLGIMYMVRGDPARALDSFREALATEESMSASAPDNADYVVLVANGHYYTGDALGGLRWYADALAAERRALGLYEGLQRADPRNDAPQKNIGGCTQKMAEILLAQGDPSEARRLLERTISIRRELADHDKGNIEYLDDLADSLMLSGESLLAGGDPVRALSAFDEARVIREPIVASRPRQAVYGRGLARLYSDLGDASAALAAKSIVRREVSERWRSARRWYEKASRLWLDLRDRRALWASESGRPDETARKLATCDRELQVE
jgi:non-specific serine/threonine protein kinase/serine/threonine-protein kinase